MATNKETVGSFEEDAAVVTINNDTNDANIKEKLDPALEKVTNEQVHTENYKISYWKLYSHATKRDWFLMIFGLIFASIAGAVVVSICSLKIFLV
jgi:hypothetical protein